MTIEKVKIPKTLAACGDLLYQIRAERLEAEKDIAAMQANETILKDHIIRNLPKSDATGVRGKVAQVTITTTEEPTVKDWDKVWAYIKKNNAFELLQRRINSSAVKERWEDKKTIPGVEKFELIKVNCTKL